MALTLTFGGVAYAVTQEEDHDEPVTGEGPVDEEGPIAETSEEHGAQEAPNPILPAWNEVIWGGLAFVVLLLVLWKLALPPIQKMMEERSAKISADIDAAEAAKVEATTVLDDYRRQLADAKSEAGRIIEEARQQSDALRRELQVRAESDIAELRQRAEADITTAKDAAMSDIRAQVASLAVGAAEVIIERNLDRDSQVALVESFINRVGAGPAHDNGG